jgi:hypothetical protein
VAYINQYLLSDPRLYCDIVKQLRGIVEATELTIDSERIKNITYASWQQRHYFWPDQVFHGHWKNFEQRKKQGGFWSLALLEQAARFHFDSDSRRLAIQSIKFDAWQSWISKQSGLPVIACQINNIIDHALIRNDNALYNKLKSLLGFRSIVSPHHPLVEDFIEEDGLHETHLHLNGTTLVEQLWNHALQHPELICTDLEKEKNNTRVKLLYASNPYLSKPQDYYKLLILARHVRELLLTWLYQDDEALNIAKANVLNAIQDVDVDEYFHNESLHFDTANYWSHVSELHWQVKVQNKLKSTTSVEHNLIDTCYLLYILSMNCYLRLTVQGADQYGFDQFQKFADDGSREEIETEYKSRFFQLHGPNALGKSDLATLEARFAPKKSIEKNEKLIRNILIGFLEYAHGEIKLNQSEDLDDLAKEVLKVTRPKLRLVAHFIKQKWSVEDGGFYYQSLRESLITSGSQLVELLVQYPTLKQIVVGIDAAGNELDAPPEVFSSFYRYCRVQAFENFTYHVGEDFDHLVTGIRSTFDAVTFLDLKNGDRIGHATAIGICPKLWISSMPERIYIKRSDWLDNLLFIRKIVLSNIALDFPILKLEEDILKYLVELGLDNNINMAQAAFDLRDIEPEVLSSYLSEKTSSLVGWLAAELQRIEKLSKPHLKFLQQKWFGDNCLKKAEELIEIQLNDTSVELIIQLQQYVQKIISEKHVVIESLPTSNVRISHYKGISEHHIFRWLGIDGRKVYGDSNMLITLGSDDPGIFATDMRNEIYHVFSTLRHEFNLDPHVALNHIKILNQNGRIYGFDYADDEILTRAGYASFD